MTATLYSQDGGTKTDTVKHMAAAQKQLKSRVADILVQNPWLNCGIVQDKKNRTLVLEYHDDLSPDKARRLANRIVRRIDPNDLKMRPSMDMTYEEFVDIFRPLVHQSTASIIGDKNALLWDMLLVPAAAQNEF